MAKVDNTGTIGADYAEYRCQACKKEIKSLAVRCESCTKLFFHPGCISKHRIYNKDHELVKCDGPFKQFESETGKTDVRRNIMIGTHRERLGLTGAAVAVSSATSGGPADIDMKIDWIVKSIREMRDELACKKDIKKMIAEIVNEELRNIKEDIEQLRDSIRRGVEVAGRNYSEVVKERKKESVIIVKPKKQQGSDVTKNLVKQNVDIAGLAVGVSTLRRAADGAVILGCDRETEMLQLKTKVQDKLGNDFKITEPKQTIPKIKVTNVDEEDMKLEEECLMDIIKRQNKLDEGRQGFLRVIKKIIKEKINVKASIGRSDGSLILEVDEITHGLMINNGKINLEWRKCNVYDYLSVKRCFKCWGYFHIAKNCMRQETCYKCAGNHKAKECTATKQRCVNCMHKIEKYNLNTIDEHDALNKECPTYKRAIERERKKIGREVNK